MPFITTKDARWLQMSQCAYADIYHQPEYVALDAMHMGGRALAWYYETGSVRCLIPLIERAIDSKESVSNVSDSRETGQARALYDLVSPYGYPGLLFDTSVDALHMGASIIDAAELDAARMCATQTDAIQMDTAQMDTAQVQAFLSQFNSDAENQGYVSTFIRLNPLHNDFVINEHGCLIRYDHVDKHNLHDHSLNNHGLKKHSLLRQVQHGETLSVDLKQYVNNGFRFSDNHRRNLRTLHQTGYRAVINDFDYLDAFIAAYYETMDRRGAKSYYYFPKDYFERLIQTGDSNRMLFIAVLSPEGVFSGGGIFTLFNGVMQYHLGATYNRSIMCSPSKLMIETAINEGIKRGAGLLHLGGGLGAARDGIYRFKAGFSGNVHTYRCLHYIHRMEIYESLQNHSPCADNNIMKETDNPGANDYFPAYRISG